MATKVYMIPAAQTSCDASGKAPADPAAPHGDHCLAHIAAAVPQDSSVAIEYVTSSHCLIAMLAPETAELTSPFEPPRA